MRDSDLVIALRGGDADAVAQWIDQGGDPNEQLYGGLVLSYGVKHPPVVRLLVEAGADPNRLDEAGATALFYAEGPHVEESIAILLDRGADPKIVDRRRNTPLMRLARSFSDEPLTVRALLLAGVPRDAVDLFGETALHHAVRHQNLAIVRALVWAGCDRDAENSERQTPTTLAGEDRDLLDALRRPGARRLG